MNEKNIINEFNDCITSQDLTGLASLLTDDHVFIDSADSVIRGKEKSLVAWSKFFSMVPDYRNVFEQISIKENMATMTGHSECSDKRLDGPALWTARIENNKIAEWRVYDDTPENRVLLGLV